MTDASEHVMESMDLHEVREKGAGSFYMKRMNPIKQVEHSSRLAKTVEGPRFRSTDAK